MEIGLWVGKKSNEKPFVMFSMGILFTKRPINGCILNAVVIKIAELHKSQAYLTTIESHNNYSNKRRI